MPLTSLIRSNKYDGNGVTTIFAYQFKIENEAHIDVYVGGVLQTLTTHYSVSGVGDNAGGNITFVTAPASGTNNVQLHRNVPRTQNIDVTDGEALPSDSIDSAHDLLMAALQDLGEEVDRCVKIPLLHTAASWDEELPDPGVAANVSGTKALTLTGTKISTATITTDNIANPLTAKGDLLTHDGSDPVKLGVGADNTLLVADSGTTEGLDYDTLETVLERLMTTRGDIIIRDATGAVRLAVGSADQVLTSDGTDISWGAVPNIGTNNAAMGANYILIRDEQTSGTAGGTATSGSFETRTLNTEVIDGPSAATLSSNQITLVAGSYIIRAVAPAFQVNSHQARWQNVTDATTTVIGTSEIATSPDNVGTSSLVVGHFTIASSKAFELQHRVTTTKATNGHGDPAIFGTEVYAIVELWKV